MAGNGIIELREMTLGTRERFAYLQCAGCGCVQIAEVPADIGRYYPTAYGGYTYVERLKRLWPMARWALRMRDCYAVGCGGGLVGRILSGRYPDVPLRSLAALNPRRDMTILDVGCGGGHLLGELREIGFRNLLGVDLFVPRPILHGNGVKVRKQPLGETEGTWELVMFHHSLEHMPEPGAALVAAAKRLAPGGTVLIRTPIVPNAAFSSYGANWVQLDAPRHVLVHSLESLRLLGERAGLRIVAVVHDSDAFQFWGSEQCARDIPLCDPRSHSVSRSASPFTRAAVRRYRRRAAELNRRALGDQVAVYLAR